MKCYSRRNSPPPDIQGRTPRALPAGPTPCPEVWVPLVSRRGVQIGHEPARNLLMMQAFY